MKEMGLEADLVSFLLEVQKVYALFRQETGHKSQC